MRLRATPFQFSSYVPAPTESCTLSLHDALPISWQAVRDGVEVKLLPQDQELYVLAQSRARIHKERAMRRRKLKWLWGRLEEIAAMELPREELLMKFGAARAKARAAWRLVDVAVAPEGATLSFTL